MKEIETHHFVFLNFVCDITCGLLLVFRIVTAEKNTWTIYYISNWFLLPRMIIFYRIVKEEKINLRLNITLC